MTAHFEEPASSAVMIEPGVVTREGPPSDAGEASPSDDSGLRRNRDFRVVLAGQGISAMGDAVNVTALPLLVLQLTGSGTQMGLVGFFQNIPDLIFGLPAGALSDRWDRKKAMLLADFGRAALTALIPLSYPLGWPTMAVIMLVTGPINILRVFWMAAYTASVPGLVGRKHVAAGSSAFEALFSLGYIIGPAVAGLLASLIGPGPTITVVAISFAISASSILLIRRPLEPPAAHAGRDIVTEIREGFDFVRHHRALRAAVLYWGFFNLAFAPILPALTVMITRDRGLDSQALGLVISTFGVGALAGSLLASRAARGRIGPVLLGTVGLTGLLTVALALASSLLLMLPPALLIGGANTMLFVAYASFRVTVTPDRLLGRVGSLGRMISFGLQPVGMLAGGILIDLTNGTTVVAIIGLGAFGLAIISLFSRSLRHASMARHAVES